MIGRDIAQLRKLSEFLDNLLGPVIQFISIRVLERVLVLRSAHAVFDGEVLHRLHVKCDSIHFLKLWLQTTDHIRSANLSLTQRLEIDQHASAVKSRVSSIDADERRQAFHSGILQNNIR